MWWGLARSSPQGPAHTDLCVSASVTEELRSFQSQVTMWNVVQPCNGYSFHSAFCNIQIAQGPPRTQLQSPVVTWETLVTSRSLQIQFVFCSILKAPFIF